jgi:outer membrane protein
MSVKTIAYITFAGFITLAGIPTITNAENLDDIYLLAVKNDPQFLAAYATYQAELTSRPQARALLLPSANFSAEESDNSHDSTITGKDDFRSSRYTLSISQPVFHYDYFVQFGQANESVKKATAEYSAAQQELILRVAQGYFDVLAATDTLEFAQSEKTAISRQLEQARKRFEVGLIAITDVHEARAAFDLAHAQEIAAENQVSSSREALGEITGQYHEQLLPLGEKLPLLTPEPANLESWTAVALKQNLQLRAAEYASNIAQGEIKRLRSGHFPTLDLVASRNHSDVGGGFGARVTDTDTVTLQFNLPLFQGGLVSYQVKEAVHLYKKTKENQEQQRRGTLRQTRDAYRGVLTDISRVKALKQATISTQSAVEATEAGFEVGTRTIVDVLVSQRELFRARRDYAQTRYDYIINTLRLKQAAGTLKPEDLEDINQWVQP